MALSKLFSVPACLNVVEVYEKKRVTPATSHTGF